MNTRMIFARGVAWMMLLFVIGCMSHAVKESDIARVFLGVDLSKVPEWNGHVSGTETTTTGCRPFQYRTKEVKLSPPFVGFESMVLCSAKRYLRSHSLRLVDCNWDSVGVESVCFRRSENDECWEKASAQAWLSLVASTMYDMFGVEMKTERESEGLIAMRGETENMRIYCSVSQTKTESTSCLSSKARISYSIDYNLQVYPKNTVHVAPSGQPRRPDVEVEVNI